MKKTFSVTYARVSVVDETWKKTRNYCPRCGKQSVWGVNGYYDADYYVEERYICVACYGTYYLPGGVTDANDEQDKQRLAKLTDDPYPDNTEDA